MTHEQVVAAIESAFFCIEAEMCVGAEEVAKNDKELKDVLTYINELNDQCETYSDPRTWD